VTSTFEPVFDEGQQYSVVADAEAALRAEDWTRVVEVFGHADAYQQQCILQLTGHLDACESMLEEVLQRNPSDSLAATLLAQRHVERGWSVLGDGPAAEVTADQWAAYRQHLVTAEKLLIRVCAEHPQYVPAWRVRLVTSRGLDLGVVESQRRFQRLSAISPGDLAAQQLMFQELLPKWHGDFGKAHDFAWSCANAAPPGSPHAYLVVVYHLERWIAEHGIALGKPVDDPQAAAEIVAAGEMSVMNPGFITASGWIVALSHFALAYTLLEKWPQAQSCFTRLGPFASEFPWAYFDDGPRSAFMNFRKRAMGVR
jgi:hypothetical protein